MTLPRAGLETERIGTQVAARRTLGYPPLLVQAQQLAGGGLDITPGVQDHGGQVEVDALQGRAQRGHRDAAVADGQPQRGDAVLQVREDRAVVGGGVPLTHVPTADRVSLRPTAAHKRGEPG